ncbi:hypothetical protein ACTA71_009182 [Dictyostelium dimigraforme]
MLITPSNPYTASSNNLYGGDNLYKFNFCNVTVDRCHGFSGESPLNIYSTACQSNYYQTGSVKEVEQVNYNANGITITTSSYYFNPIDGNDCSKSPVPNRRRMIFNFICDPNQGTLAFKTKVMEDPLVMCTYSVDMYSSLVCNCGSGCSKHGKCLSNGDCDCDSKTSGIQCGTSRIVITQVLYFVDNVADNIELVGYFGSDISKSTIKIGSNYQCNNIKQKNTTNISCTLATKIVGSQNVYYVDGDLSTTFLKEFDSCTSHGVYDKAQKKCICDSQTSGIVCEISNIQIINAIQQSIGKINQVTVIGFFGTITKNSSIKIGGLQCNNLKQINQTHISCEIQVQYGVKNVLFTDNDLSSSMLIDFETCTSHGVYSKVQKKCICDSQTGGEFCEISKIIINDVYQSLVMGKNTVAILGFFGTTTVNGTITVGQLQCDRMDIVSQTLIYCEIGVQYGLKNVTFVDNDLSYSMVADLKTCTSHGVYNNDLNKCVCDTQTKGEFCEVSLIVINDIDYSSTFKDTQISLIGYFGNTSQEKAIQIGELQCNNINQINYGLITCEIQVQFGFKNVTFTDSYLSYTFLKEFENCTKYGYYDSYNMNCTCDSQTTGQHCEISRIKIDDIIQPLELNNSQIGLIGYFGDPSLNKTITIGESECNSIVQLNETFIYCYIGKQFGLKKVTIIENEFSYSLIKEFDYCSHHGQYDEVSRTCICDSKTTGYYCEVSRIIIDNFNHISTLSHSNINLIGYFGDFSNVTIKIGEMECLNVNQINETLILCEITRQFGEMNVSIIDGDLSYSISNQFEKCTSHGVFERNSNACLCDSQTNGGNCQFSKIYIDSVNSPTTNGGTTVLFGFFGNISTYSTIDIGLNPCINIIQSNEESIQCEVGPGIGIQNVTFNDGDLNFTLINTFRYVTIEPPLKCLGGDNPCGGVSQGTCTKNGCVCRSPWVGSDCSSKVIIIPQPSKNYSNPTIQLETNGDDINRNYTDDTLFKSIISIVKLRELDFNSKEVNSFNFEKWQFNEIDNSTYKYESNITVPSANLNENSTITNVTITLQWFDKETNVSFAGDIIKMNPSSIKYTIEISKYKFANQLNRLQLVMSAMLGINKTDGICSNKEFGEQSNEENSNYLKIRIENHSIYGRFIKRAIVDKTKITSLENSMLDSSTLLDSTIDHQTDSISSPEAYIGITIPYYQNHIIIDPDFSMLLDSREIKSTSSICSKNGSGLSGSKIAAIVICSTFFAVAIGIGAFYYWYKKKYDEDLVKTIKMKSKKVELYM